MLKNGSKILITTSELAPLDPLPFTGIYAVTKGALDKYAYSLRMELQLLGMRVSVLRAGAVDTGIYRKHLLRQLYADLVKTGFHSVFFRRKKIQQRAVHVPKYGVDHIFSSPKK